MDSNAATWRKTKELFDEVIALAPAARASRLALLCPDPALRHAVETLLDTHDDAIETPPLPDDISTATPDAPPEGRIGPGTHIGPYLIVDRIAAGGMGEVFLGTDTRLQRRVALKCLTAPAGGDSLDRILHEARAAARISHPNVAMVHDVIEHGSRAFIVMEYVAGESLAARLRRGPMPAAAVVSIGRQLTAALVEAHARGVVHRDLKPANIQVTPDGSIKVLDFGLAHDAAIRSTHGPVQPESTRASVRFAGTPPYMAPEQLLGGRADERSDIYSLGVVLYEMATGRRPYRGSSAVDLLDAIDQAPARADAVNPGVPSALGTVIARMLAFDRTARYQTVAEVDQALARLPDDRQRARLRRRWMLTTIAAAAVVAAIAIRSLVPVPAPRRTIRSIAVLPLVNLSAEPTQDYFVDGMTDGLINTLGRVSALKVTARTSVMSFKATKRSIAEIAQALRVDAVVEGSVVMNKDASGRERVRVSVNVIDPATQTQLWSDTIEREIVDVMALQNEIARSLAERIEVSVTPDERARLARRVVVNPEALKLYLQGRQEWNKRTKDDLITAVGLFRRATAADPTYAPAYAGLADSYALLTADFGGLPRDEGARETIAAATRAIELDPTLAEGYASMGFANRVLNWNWTVAADQLRRALSLNPSYATAHQWYGNLLSDLGREREALDEMRRALELDPLSAIISRDVAWPLFFARRYDEAIAQLTDTLQRHPGYLQAERLMARAVAQKGDAADAARRFESIASRDHLARSYCELAWAYALDGRTPQAERALEHARASGSPVYPYDLALAYTALRRPDAALDALEQAYRQRDPTLLNLKHDPRLDALRSDPRFTALLQQMRFPG